jgi:hypothetical protein
MGDRPGDLVIERVLSAGAIAKLPIGDVPVYARKGLLTVTVATLAINGFRRLATCRYRFKIRDGRPILGDVKVARYNADLPIGRIVQVIGHRHCY